MSKTSRIGNKQRHHGNPHGYQSQHTTPQNRLKNRESGNNTFMARATVSADE